MCASVRGEQVVQAVAVERVQESRKTGRRRSSSAGTAAGGGDDADVDAGAGADQSKRKRRACSATKAAAAVVVVKVCLFGWLCSVGCHFPTFSFQRVTSRDVWVCLFSVFFCF